VPGPHQDANSRDPSRAQHAKRCAARGFSAGAPSRTRQSAVHVQNCLLKMLTIAHDYVTKWVVSRRFSWPVLFRTVPCQHDDLLDSQPDLGGRFVPPSPRTPLTCQSTLGACWLEPGKSSGRRTSTISDASRQAEPACSNRTRVVNRVAYRSRPREAHCSAGTTESVAR